MQRTLILVGAAIVVALLLYMFMGREPEVTEVETPAEQAVDDAEAAADAAVDDAADASADAAAAAEGAAEDAATRSRRGEARPTPATPRRHRRGAGRRRRATGEAPSSADATGRGRRGEPTTEPAPANN